MENLQKKSWQSPLYMAALLPLSVVVTAACIYLYISHYPPLIPPGKQTPQHNEQLIKAKSFVKYLFPPVGAILIVCTIMSPLSLRQRIRNLRHLNAGKQGQPPRDGSLVAVTGPIEADHKPVISPAGLKSCIAYEYSALLGTTNNSDYDGYAFTPSSINASFGKVKILAVPQIDFFGFPLTGYSDDTALDNFKAYLQTTRFVTSLPERMSFLKSRNELMPDRKRPHREDWCSKWREQKFDVDEYRIRERCIEEGEIVCAFGMYSAAQQGLMPNPGLGDYYWIGIERGPIAGLIRKQRFAIARNLVVIACMLAGLTVMIWAYQNFYYVFGIMYNFGFLYK